jgi:hypothetical protein
MKLVIVVGCALWVGASPALAGQLKYGATATVEKGVDFSKFKTYSWTPGQPSSDKTIDAWITAAVDRQFGALGMSKVGSGSGDVLVTYASVTRTDVDMKAKPDAKELRPQYLVGSLNLALLEPANRRRLLRLRVDRPINAERSKLEAAIEAAVAEMFTQYPGRKAK